MGSRNWRGGNVTPYTCLHLRTTTLQPVKRFVDSMGSQMDYTVALDTSGEVQEGARSGRVS